MQSNINSVFKFITYYVVRFFISKLYYKSANFAYKYLDHCNQQLYTIIKKFFSINNTLVLKILNLVLLLIIFDFPSWFDFNADNVINTLFISTIGLVYIKYVDRTLYIRYPFVYLMLYTVFSTLILICISVFLNDLFKVLMNFLDVVLRRPSPPANSNSGGGNSNPDPNNGGPSTDPNSSKANSDHNYKNSGNDPDNEDFDDDDLDEPESGLEADIEGDKPLKKTPYKPTAASKARITARRHERLANRTPAQVEADRIKKSKSRPILSQAEKDALNAARREKRANRTDKQKEIDNALHKQYNEKSAANNLEKNRERAKNWYYALSDERKQGVIDRISTNSKNKKKINNKLKITALQASAMLEILEKEEQSNT